MFVGIVVPLTLARSEGIPTHVEIAPGVSMPYVNLGGVHSHPSNYSAWLHLGGTGLDSALMYGDDVQVEVEPLAFPRFAVSESPAPPAESRPRLTESPFF